MVNPGPMVMNPNMHNPMNGNPAFNGGESKRLWHHSDNLDINSLPPFLYSELDDCSTNDE